MSHSIKKRENDWQIRFTVSKDLRETFDEHKLAFGSKDRNEFVKEVLRDFFTFYVKRDEDGDLWFPDELVKMLYRHMDISERERFAEKIAEITEKKFTDSRRPKNTKTLVAYLKRYFKHSNMKFIFDSDTDILHLNHQMGLVWSEVTGLAIVKTLKRFGVHSEILEQDSDSFHKKLQIYIDPR